MVTIKEITQKIINGTATSADFAELAKLSKEEEKHLKTVEQNAEKVVSDVKAMGIAPALLTKLLSEAGLIELPKPEPVAFDIYVKGIKTKTGRDSTFRIWNNREVNKLTGEAKTHWEEIKKAGFEDFVSKLTEQGKEFYATKNGKKWVDDLFSVK